MESFEGKFPKRVSYDGLTLVPQTLRETRYTVHFKGEKICKEIIPPGTLMALQTLWTPTDSSQMKIFPLTHPDQVFFCPTKKGPVIDKKFISPKRCIREKFHLQNLGVAEVFLLESGAQFSFGALF